MGILIGIISALIAIFAIKLQFFSKPKEELNHLKVQFKATQQLSLEFQKKLENYIKENNASDKEMFTGIKFKTYLEDMKLSYQKNLSDKLFGELDTLDLTKSTIISMTKSLEEQSGALSQLQAQLNILIKQSNSD